MALPATLDDISSHWLHEALSTRFPGAAVTGFAVEKILHGTATKAKLRLDYAPGSAAGAPETLWIKAGMEEHSAFMATIGIYEHEAQFYRDLSARLSLAAPDCFYAAAEPSSRRGVLLLEDLDRLNARMCSASEPVSTEVVREGLTALAHLHDVWLEAPELDEHPWLDPPLQKDDHYFTTNSTPDVLAKWLNEPRGKTFPAAIRDPERLSSALGLLSRQVLQEPHGILHGDIHVGNSYHVSGEGTRFYDWQVVGKGPGMFDVAYYMGSALSVEDRRSAERDLIAHYVACRNASGRATIDFETEWHGYRRYLAYGCWAWVTNPPEFQLEDLCVITSNRFAAAMDDLDSFAALEEAA